MRWKCNCLWYHMLGIGHATFDSYIVRQKAVNQLTTVERLLEKATDPNLVGLDGNMPLHAAAKEGGLVCVQMLLEAFADINHGNVQGHTALALAADRGLVRTADLLVKKLADVDLADFIGRTPLMKAAKRGYEEIVEHLVVERARIDARDRHGCTAIHLAAQHGHAACVDLLLGAYVDSNVLDDNGDSALWQAVRGDTFADYHSVTVVQALLEAIADPNCRCSGSFPLLCAIAEQRYHIVWLLLEAAADSNCCTLQKDHALHVAARGNMSVAVEWLLARQADPWRINDVERTPLSVAVANCSWSTVPALRQAMFDEDED
eukprot:s1010_g8.t1